MADEKEPRESARLRVAIGRAVKYGDTEGERVARQNYYAQVLEEKIAEVIAKAPPLRPDQIERLRELFAPRNGA